MVLRGKHRVVSGSVAANFPASLARTRESQYPILFLRHSRLEALLLRCTASSAGDRPQTVHELHDARLEIYDPDAWTTADAEAFWRSAERNIFNENLRADSPLTIAAV
jgi:hypothetical protein